jgi:Pentapeptide repeats (8 copies)
MANEEQVAELKKGVTAWNAWREENPTISHPILGRAELQEANLNGANLIGASLSGANLSGASLNGANLIEAVLQRANLSEASMALSRFRWKSSTAYIPKDRRGRRKVGHEARSYAVPVDPADYPGTSRAPENRPPRRRPRSVR